MYKHALQLEFKITNNEVEYEILLSGLRLTRELQVSELDMFSNLQLVISQVDKSYKAWDATIAKYLVEMHWLIHCFLQLIV